MFEANDIIRIFDERFLHGPFLVNIFEINGFGKKSISILLQ